MNDEMKPESDLGRARMTAMIQDGTTKVLQDAEILRQRLMAERQRLIAEAIDAARQAEIDRMVAYALQLEMDIHDKYRRPKGI